MLRLRETSESESVARTSSWRIWMAALLLRMSAAAGGSVSISACPGELVDERKSRRTLAHEPRRVDLGLSGDDLGLAEAALLRSRRERRLDLARDGDILDEEVLDLRAGKKERRSASTSASEPGESERTHPDAPALAHALDDLLDLSCDALAVGEEALERASADDVAQGGLSALDERLADVRDREGGVVRARDVEDDDGLDGSLKVVLGEGLRTRGGSARACSVGDGLETHLLHRDLDDLDLDVDDAELLRERVDLRRQASARTRGAGGSGRRRQLWRRTLTRPGSTALTNWPKRVTRPTAPCVQRGIESVRKTGRGGRTTAARGSSERRRRREARTNAPGSPS